MSAHASSQVPSLQQHHQQSTQQRAQQCRQLQDQPKCQLDITPSGTNYTAMLKQCTPCLLTHVSKGPS